MDRFSSHAASGFHDQNKADLLFRKRGHIDRMFVDRHANWSEIEAVSTVSILLIAIVLWFGAGQVIAHSERNAGIQTALTARADSDDSKFEGTENGLYIWPQWWSTVQHYYSAQGKLPPKEVLQHNIPLGFWVSGQVYFNEMLKTQGTPNPATALLDRSDVFLVEGQEETLLAQMKAHYGEDLRLMEAGTLAEGQKLYRVVREEN